MRRAVVGKVRDIEVASGDIGDAPMPPDLLGQVPATPRTSATRR
jgi:hypothetical protein